MAKTKPKKQPVRSESQWLTAMCQVLKGTGLGCVVMLAAALLSAVLISGGMIRDAATGGMAPACCVLGGLSGGILALNKPSDRPVLLGIGTGAALFLVQLCVGCILYEGTSVAHHGGGLLCACCCGGAIAGIFRRKPKKKRRR